MKPWNAVEARNAAKFLFKSEVEAARERYLSTLGDIDARDRRGRDRAMAEARARYQRAFDLRQSGKTFKEVGEELGVSVSRASQMVMKHSRRLYLEEKTNKKLRNGAALRSTILADFEKRSKGKSPEEVSNLVKELISSVVDQSG